MSIAIYIGHTGQRFELDPSGSTNSLEGLRSWIASQAGVQPRCQILLTAHGKQVRAQTLLTETELFVFDSNWLNGDKAASPANDTDSNDFHPGSAPDTIANEKDLQSWQNLFRLRKSWAAGLLNGCTSRSQQAAQYHEQQAVIERSLAVAVQSLQHHIKSAEKQFAGAESRAQEPLQEYQAHVDNWEHNLGSLRNVPARTEFSRFIPPMASASGSRRLSQQNISTLQGFVDVVAIKQAATAARSTLNDLSHKIDQMREDLGAAATKSDELLHTVDRINSQSPSESASEPVQLVEEIGLVAQKMASDFEHVQSLPKNPTNVSSASKMALLHTKKYVPSLLEYCAEMNDLVHKNKHQRDSAAEIAWTHMRTLSVIESQLAKLFHEVKELDISEDHQHAFNTLAVVSRLPSVYGQLLVESVRRREWVAKMKRDCSTLQEEVAAYQDEEERRRKKWVRVVEDVVVPESLQSRALGIELSLQNEGGSWPMTTRDELEQYLSIIFQVYGQGPVTEEIEQAIRDLDKPTRKQIKHAKAFKNGSMHEAAFGDTSLLLRGDEQYKGLRDTNARLEEDLKTQRSRVRKLEDLLHRQTQASRASTGDAFTPTSDPSYRGTTPPVNLTPQPSEDFSRHSSLSRRRPSLVGGLEEKRLAKRVVDLEAELLSHKNEAASRKSSDAEFQKQVEEATSTKRDLMENMEAQQREFASERRALEKDLGEAKEKVEELENEIERLLGSRDGVDEENARLKEDAAGHAARAATEHDARNVLERRLQIAEEAKLQAEAEVQRLRLEREQKREFEAEQLQSLATAHAHLSPDAEVPNDISTLSIVLEELARKSAAHNKDLAEAVAFAKSENESLRASNERQKSELASATERQSEYEDQVREAQEKLVTEEARAKTLEQQLGEEQEQLQLLRSKFADGETGSEVLRQRVAEEEARSRSLSSELAESKSHINSLDIELMRLQKKHKSYHASVEASSERLQNRAERAKELSQRIYLQNQRLGRLLERLGLVISYHGDGMTIDRASKMAASTMILDPHSQMSRQMSAQSPPPTRKPSSSTDAETAADLRLLHWPDAQEAEEEGSQFEAFMKQISRFDLDVFADAVTKRVKDFEYTAKKYSKEAKESTKRADAYKERAVKLRNEAHAKIAVRDFKEGDLALFLPTRGGQVKGAWAAFNIGCPHYFLAERDGMRLGTRDFIVARIQKVEQKVVDLSGQRSGHIDGRSIEQVSEPASSMQVEDDNPFDLSDGLTWWMVHASEERGAGAAPTTPGLGKSTVAAANVDATGSINPNRSSKGADASKRLNKSLDSRRSSTASKKGITPATPTAPVAVNTDGASHYRSESQTSSLGQQQQQHHFTKPLPAAASSGLGITAHAGEQPSPASQQHEQIRNIPSTISIRAQPTSPGSPGAASPTNLQARARSKSPSKSIRSLQRHLDQQPLSPQAKASPAKPRGRNGAGWESIFSAEFSLESPSKERKGST